MNIEIITKSYKNYMSCLQSAVNVCFEKMKIGNVTDVFVWGGSLCYVSKGEKTYENINVIYRNDTNEHLEKYFDVAVDCLSLPSEDALKIAHDSLGCGMIDRKSTRLNSSH